MGSVSNDSAIFLRNLAELEHVSDFTKEISIEKFARLFGGDKNIRYLDPRDINIGSGMTSEEILQLADNQNF